MKTIVAIVALFCLTSCGNDTPPKQQQTIYEADTTTPEPVGSDTTKKAEEVDDHSQEQMEELAIPLN